MKNLTGDGSDLNQYEIMEDGVRIFKGLNNFKVYHFGSISLRKKKDLKKNNVQNFLKNVLHQDFSLIFI